MAPKSPPRVAIPVQSSPNPAAPVFRPAPTRAASLAANYPLHKTRAASQPAHDRIPARNSTPDSGRGSPSSTGAFGVIGGSRTPGRFGAALAVGGAQTRANSFSAAEMQPRTGSLTRTLSSHVEEHPSRSNSDSPFPTFSPSSSPSASPATLVQQPLPHTHSPPKAGANVSRSRSQSLATGVRPQPERPYMAPMSTLENTGTFTRFEQQWAKSPDGSNMSPFTRGMPYNPDPHRGQTRFRTQDVYSEGWDDHLALSTSVAHALGQQSHQPHATGYNENGGKSGSSSRRHSVSVVGGPGGRRDFIFGEGGGMTSMASPPGGFRGIGLVDLLPERLDNALSLEIDQSRRRGIEIEMMNPQDRRGYNPPRVRGATYGGEYEGFSPDRSRREQFQYGDDRASSLEHREESQRNRFDTAPAVNTMLKNGLSAMSITTPTRGRDQFARGPEPIGSPPTFEPRMLGQYGMQPGHYPVRAQFPAGAMGPTSPSFRPPGYGFYAPRPPMAGPPPPFTNGPTYSQPINQFAATYPYPNAGSPPSSPSFSSLSLADLGRGISLNALAPNTPLYIVTFKAGRRDVFYCPDPTLLISNGDRVIVEADRGSDLGMVIYDQLTPIDVREWQEKQATAALLSGASQHQPPGMVQQSTPSKPKPRAVGVGELAGADLGTLLAGVGPGGQLDLGGTQARGPLAKEVMPKRIFAKSSQGQEEQARMMDKVRDEHEALMICREKVAQRGLPMQVVDAEYQWDRRKLTFYFKADKRVDFRDLTKENFRIFKNLDVNGAERGSQGMKELLERSPSGEKSRRTSMVGCTS